MGLRSANRAAVTAMIESGKSMSAGRSAVLERPVALPLFLPNIAKTWYN
jgi:hypothetical protein